MMIVYVHGSSCLEIDKMMYTQGRHNDCVIISVANYTGKSYDEVMNAFIACNLTRESILAHGVPQCLIPLAVSKLIGRIVSITKPRRGQDRISGLASWHRPTKANGHCTVIMDGSVIDTNGRTYESLAAYRHATGYVMRGAIKID